MNNFFIFSDEVGSWANEKCNFYIRSWVKISEEKYLYLKVLWNTKKLPDPTFSSLLKNSNRIVDILDKENFEFIFTITKLNEFYLRKWGIRDGVSLALSQLENKLQREYEKKYQRSLRLLLIRYYF